MISINLIPCAASWLADGPVASSSWETRLKCKLPRWTSSRSRLIFDWLEVWIKPGRGRKLVSGRVNSGAMNKANVADLRDSAKIIEEVASHRLNGAGAIGSKNNVEVSNAKVNAVVP